MAHLELLTYGTPSQHENFIRKINTFKYPYKGRTRQGKIAPTVSEIKLYDIRIPEEHVAQFTRDINAMMPEPPFGPREKKMGLGLWKIFNWFLRKFTPLKKVVPEKNQMYRFPDDNTWFYVFCLGKITDTQQKDMMTGKTKEVL
jgi:hypothetical protein